MFISIEISENTQKSKRAVTQLQHPMVVVYEIVQQLTWGCNTKYSLASCYYRSELAIAT